MKIKEKITKLIFLLTFILAVAVFIGVETKEIKCDTSVNITNRMSSIPFSGDPIAITEFHITTDLFDDIVVKTEDYGSAEAGIPAVYYFDVGDTSYTAEEVRDATLRILSSNDGKKQLKDSNGLSDGDIDKLMNALESESITVTVNGNLRGVTASLITLLEETNGYKVYLEIAKKDYSELNLPNEVQEKITQMMRDFRNYAITLQNTELGNKMDGNIKNRITEFCLQAGFNPNVCYGLRRYIEEYGTSWEKGLTSSYSTIDNDSIYVESHYFNNGKPIDFSESNHHLFYYFIKTFYDYDEHCRTSGSLSVDGINGYYVALMGQINATVSSDYNNASLGAGLGKAFLSVLSASTDNLAESVVNCLARDVCWGLMELMEKAGDSIMNFCPSIEEFLKYFGGIGNDESSAKELFNLNNMFYYLGAFLLVILALTQLVTIIINPEEAKTDVKTLVVKFIVCGVAIYWGRTIVGWIFHITNRVWNWCFGTSAHISNGSIDPDRQIIYNTMKLMTTDYFGIHWTYAVVGVLFNCAVGFIILKNVFSVLAECVERYIVACLLYFTFPSAVALGVSKTTEDAFKSYIRMLACQLFMLFINLYFILGFVILLRTENFLVWSESFYGLLFVVAYLKVAQAFDSYLSSLGLSVAHTGGNLGRELFGVGSTVMAGMLMLGRTGLRVGTALANGGAKGFGSILSGATTRMDSSSKGVLKAFNLGENLRRGGLRGLSGGSKVDASTMSMLESRRTGLYGLKRVDTFKNALSGSVNGSILNANPELKKQFMDGIKGAKGIGNMVKSADFYGHGGGASITASIKSQNDRMITTSGSLFNDMASVKTSGSTSSARPMLSTTMGDTLYGSFSTRTNCPTGTTFALNKDSIQRTSDGAFFATASEMGLGVDLTKDARVQAHTLDLASNGNELKLSQLESGNILVQRATGEMDSRNNPIFSTEGYIVDGKWREPDIKGSSYTGFTADDFNNGRFADLKPNENATCYAVADFSEIANPESPLFNPSYLQRYAELHSDEGLRQATENLMSLRADYEDTNGKFTEMAERFVEEVNTDGSDASNFFEMAQSISPWEFEDRPSSVAEVETMISTIKDNELVYAMDSQFLDSDYIHLCDLAHEKESIFTQEQQEIDRIKDVKFDEGTVALYTDTNGGYFANEIHPATVKETGERNDYTVIPLDTSRDLRGDEQHVREWDYRRVNNSPKSKNP